MRRFTLALTLMSASAVLMIGCNRPTDTGATRASGHIEATEIRLAAKVGGRLLEAPLEEG